MPTVRFPVHYSVHLDAGFPSDPRIKPPERIAYLQSAERS
jgi:hypothetical protein